MTNLELLQKVLAERREIQARNEQEEQRREREVSEQNPEIGRLIDERRRAIFAGLRQALDGVIPFGIEQDTLPQRLGAQVVNQQQGHMHVAVVHLLAAAGKVLRADAVEQRVGSQC